MQKALQQTPDDFSLSEVRYHIRAALTKLENVEKKREKREVNANRRASVAAAGNSLSAFDPAKVIEIIDMMMDDERAKIEEIQNRRNKKGEDGETLYG